MDQRKIPREIEEIEIPKLKLHIKKIVIPLSKLSGMEPKDEYNYIKDTLKGIYEDKLSVDRKLILKCVSLTCSKEDIRNYLPYGLIVEKKKENLIFRTDKKRNIILLLVFINILAFAMITASYSAIDYLSKIDLNKDINGDGIPDINLDLNNDGKAEINIDTNRDDKPNINVDYKGNKKSVFNIDTNGDNKADTNLITKAEKGICKKNQINCDINGDGWPDVNIDLDGDGKADIDIDSDQNGVIDLNIDSDGNGICDINCDTNGDWVCDENCLEPEVIEKIVETIVEKTIIITQGSTNTTGNPNVDSSTASLLVVFTDSEELVATDIYPDDQPGIVTVIPDKVFTIENKTSTIQYYNLSWIVGLNTFRSNNFMYKVVSTNGGGELDFTTYPQNNHIFLSNIPIAPYVTQTYTISSKLRGMNEAQNEDQGRTFTGKIQVDLLDQISNG